uniref:Uncharacterized protein n=1 Tax=Panagrellus redivivus TaxID=6233 RepID=A0A7E4WDW4_PANRE
MLVRIDDSRSDLSIVYSIYAISDNSRLFPQQPLPVEPCAICPFFCVFCREELISLLGSHKNFSEITPILRGYCEKEHDTNDLHQRDINTYTVIVDTVAPSPLTLRSLPPLPSASVTGVLVVANHRPSVVVFALH